MIIEASILLRDEVRRYLLQSKDIARAADVVLGNVAALENDDSLANRVLMTLVNIEEESTLKNQRHSSRSASGNGMEFIAPPVYLNLYFLFSATLPKVLPQADDDELYERAMRRISSVIELFQSKKEFTLQNSPGFEPGGLDRGILAELRLHPALYTLTFEQINHLWGALGGRQSLSVMYKVRVVRIQSLVSEEAPLIETIQEDARPVLHV